MYRIAAQSNRALQNEQLGIEMSSTTLVLSVLAWYANRPSQAHPQIMKALKVPEPCHLFGASKKLRDPLISPKWQGSHNHDTQSKKRGPLVFLK